MKQWHLIIDHVPLKGSLNMAVDEFLFSSITEEPQTFVRFYQWQNPTVSLGYSQQVEKAVDLEFCHTQGIDVVRRITGGKLVLHHQEVTYSVCSSDGKTFTSTLQGSYRLISQALMKGLKKMGLKSSLAEKSPSFYAQSNLPCFSHPAQNEIEIEGRKIIGSAQKRIGKKFLQHGSVPLEHDERLLKSVSLLNNDDTQVRLTSLSQALGRKIDFEWAVKCLASGISEFFCASLKLKVFNDQEMRHILKIQTERYESDLWTLTAGRNQKI